MAPFFAEILGTAILIYLGNGVVANVVLKGTKGNSGGWIVITWAWALAVFVAVFVTGPISGAHINPAVTVSLALAGSFPWASVPIYVAGQLIGAAVGATLVWLHYRDHFAVTEDADGKLACFSTGPAIRSVPSNFLSEMLGTFLLVFAILHITGPSLKLDGLFGLLSDDRPLPSDLAPPVLGLGALDALPVALLVFVIGLSLGGTTGYAINPARDLGPRIMHAILPIPGKRDSDWGYAWIPIIAPLVGGGLAAAFYLAIK